MRPTVAFRYGFTEGKWHGKRFRRQLRQQGFKIINNATEADYVIAHSGGCFDVPKLRGTAVLLLINPPYWPEQTVGTRAKNMTLQLARAIRPGNKPFYQTHKTARNALYLLRHARTNRYMIRRSRTFNLEHELSHHHTILVRNTNDPWLTPQLGTLQSLHPQLTVKTLPGDHDDCWLHPEPYINLLQS